MSGDDATASTRRHRITQATVGIVGAGVIAEAMVDGFLSKGTDNLSVVLSPRGAAVVTRLVSRHPQAVRAATTNQEVLDACSTIILAVRPHVARDVLAELRFRSDHHVISVVAGFSREEILKLAAPVQEVTLAIPLPAMARGDAPTVILPPNEAAAALFRHGGTVTQVDNANAYAALGTSTAIMASYFALAKTVTDWLVRNNVPEGLASNYVAHLLQGLSETTQLRAGEKFQELEEYHATPGSFNDALRNHLREHGAFKSVATGLDELMKRMLG